MVQTAVAYYGYFPSLDTKKEWEDGKDSAEKQADWEDYFDTYKSRCEVNLIIIAIVWRVLAWICLVYWEDIVYFVTSIDDWILEGMQKAYGISKEGYGNKNAPSNHVAPEAAPATSDEAAPATSAEVLKQRKGSNELRPFQSGSDSEV